MKGLLAACGIAAALFFAFLGAREIRNPDEPREAETARECAAGGWTVVPEMNGKPFLEHPPLFYWMTAGAIRATGGPNDFAAKAAAALLGIVAVVGMFLAGEALLGAGGGLTAALLALSMPYLVIQFRTGVGDAGLAAFTALCLGLFFQAHRRGSWTLALAAGVAAGLGFLCKGLLGYALPALAAGAWLALRRDGGAILRLRLWAAVLAGFAVAVPWVVALHAATGAEGLHRFFIWNHFGQFGADADHAQPPWFYACILWTALPLTPLAIAAVRCRSEEGRAARWAGLCWVAAPLLVLSMATGKRVVYLLPLLPGFALAGAGFLAGLPSPRREAWTARARAAALVLAALTAAYDSFVAPARNDDRSARALSARLEELAAGRPLVAFRVGEGKIGQFCWAMDRTLPWIWEEKALRRAVGEGPAVVFGQDRDIEGARAAGALSDGAFASLRPLGEWECDGSRYRAYEWRSGTHR